MLQKAVVIAMLGLLPFGAAALWGPGGLGTPQTASAQIADCGFGYINDRSVTFRRHISCAEAKRVLLQLKDHRPAGTVPMVCGRSRVVHGWRLKNLGRAIDTVLNSYQRGRVSFRYYRVQPADRRAFCPPQRPYGEDVG